MTQNWNSDWNNLSVTGYGFGPVTERLGNKGFKS